MSRASDNSLREGIFRYLSKTSELEAERYYD